MYIHKYTTVTIPRLKLVFYPLNLIDGLIYLLNKVYSYFNIGYENYEKKKMMFYFV